jgi:Protein of unknown function with PCYCGC motif
MNPRRKIAAFVALIALAVSGLLVTPRGVASRGGQSAAKSDEPIPAYHSQVPAGALPQTLDPASFENPVVQNAYALAAKVKRVLYQQPCYCHCDRSIGHGSLLDCFASKHASVCDVCIREGIYSYEQTQKKKTPAQIRAGIERGEWQQVDLSKYQTAPSKP